MFLDVLNEEGRSSQVVDGNVEETLDFLLVEVHGDDVGHSRSDGHLSQEFANDGSALAHLNRKCNNETLGAGSSEKLVELELAGKLENPSVKIALMINCKPYIPMETRHI